ncbi:glycosyltransferase family 4 protein [Pseudomonas resinovorans]|uniref:Glycosyltransferase family 4 protein n=1 Tax=Metapseudomonas resinovorans TaxID=53412 RepID=A0ABT4YC29_METRE|nr:glycosyltransferase family 4 protein [Pseudomonas resinovorans]MDA8486167.1 glycosyltransferase family 4 protein [Pseudomonas resinovorans]
MRILVLSQYFSPESFIINDVVRTLVSQRHEVVVATGKPNYPDGDIFPGYRAGGVQHHFFSDSAEVIRVPLWPRGKGGARNLILNYLSFVLCGLVFFPWLLRKREFDAILVFSPSPITQVIPAIPLKWLKRTHLAVWVQDLWPESLAATGFVRHPHLLKAVGYLVSGIYACCDTLLVQSRAFVEPVARYTRRDKIIYYPNSMPRQVPVQTVERISPELAWELEQHFSVVFAGNLGTAQAVETLLETAIQLKHDPEIRLVLVGSGSRFSWLQAQKQAHQLDNLLLPGRFPMEAMPQIFERAAALLVSLKDEEIFAQTIPSKIQAYLAAGRPIIASLRGEGARVVAEAGAGEACEPEDPAALAALIRSMKGRPAAELQAMGLAGKAYFNEHFEMSSQVRRLVEILEARAKGQN